MTAIATAFGKVILLGEHAVVYGTPALAVGIDRGARARARAAAPGDASSLALRGARTVAEHDEGDLPRALRELLQASGVRQPLAIEVETDLPAAAGLGCSAALGVAIARAVGHAAGTPPTLTQAVERAMAWERVFHGNPSGVDAAVAARGGCLSFVRGAPADDVALAQPLHLAIGHTGIASSTKTMVEAVARLRARRPEAVQKTFDGVGVLVRNARLALEAGDLTGVGKLMDLNQMLLAGLFVSTTEVEQLCGLARAAGALGAKLTGAGGGGCVVALCASTPDAVLTAWRDAGFEAFATVVQPAERFEAAAQAAP